MDIGDLVYVLIGAVWLIYSFLKKGSKKTTSGLPGNEMTEQPVEEYLPSDLSRLSAEQAAGTEGQEVVEQVEDPYETVRKEILVQNKPVVSEAELAEPDEGRKRERVEKKLEATLSSTSPSLILNTLEGFPQKPLTPTRTEKPTLTSYLQKKREGVRADTLLPFEEELPDFDLRKAVVFYEILKRPEY